MTAAAGVATLLCARGDLLPPGVEPGKHTRKLKSKKERKGNLKEEEEKEQKTEEAGKYMVGN